MPVFKVVWGCEDNKPSTITNLPFQNVFYIYFMLPNNPIIIIEVTLFLRFLLPCPNIFDTCCCHPVHSYYFWYCLRSITHCPNRIEFVESFQDFPQSCSALTAECVAFSTVWLVASLFHFAALSFLPALLLTLQLFLLFIYLSCTLHILRS